jgi:hypothetical protein
MLSTRKPVRKAGFNVSEIGKILGEMYRSNYERYFKDHPDKDKIVEALVTGTYESTEQVDRWFDEGEYYSAKHLDEALAKLPVNKDGTVTFKYWKANGS